MSNDEATLTRLLHHYEAMVQEWSIKNGEPGTMGIHGVNLGYTDEVNALRAAVELVRRHGVPQPQLGLLSFGEDTATMPPTDGPR
jgi:hypothetical protein